MFKVKVYSGPYLEYCEEFENLASAESDYSEQLDYIAGEKFLEPDYREIDFDVLLVAVNDDNTETIIKTEAA